MKFSMIKTIRLQERQPLYMAVSICLVLLISLGGYGLFTLESRQIRNAKSNELKAIAELKANQIANWRKERIADAHMNASGIVSILFNRWRTEPENAALKEDILRRLATFKRMEGYEDLILADTDGNVLVSVNPAASALDAYAKTLIARTVAANDIVFGDLFRCTVCSKVHLDVMAPVHGAGSRPEAVLILRTDPETYLYPLIQSWPTHSRSAETTVARKHGDSILFLNPLRHNQDAPVLTRRIPLSETTSPTVQAARGHFGSFEGKDYRGANVVADLRPIPDSPWIMEAKVDSSEILAELGSHRNAMILIVGLFIALTLTIAAFFYNYRQRNLYLKMFRAERALREMHEEMGATLYSIGDGVISTTPSGRIHRMNPVAEQLTGWQEAEAIDRPLEDVFQIIDELTRAKVDNPVERVVRENRVIGLANHTVLIARNGIERPIADSGAPIRDGKGNISGVVLVFRDQTEQRQAEAALAAKQQQLEELNRTLETRIQEAVSELRRKDRILINQSRMASMGEMIANIAHQWRQPLNALALVIANIRDAYLASDMNADYLNQAVSDANRLIRKMSTTISDFSNFFRPDKQAVVFSANKQILEAIQLLAFSYKKQNIAVHFDPSGDLHLTGFPNEYSQVLLNLLANARDAILAGPQTDRPLAGRVEIRHAAKNGEGRVSIRDNGGGIPADVLDKIFDPYFSTKNQGSGIGLYMCKMIIEGSMNGRITARNVDGGAEFTVVTPLAAADPALMSERHGQDRLQPGSAEGTDSHGS